MKNFLSKTFDSIFKRETPDEQAMVFPVGEGMTPEEGRRAEAKIQQLSVPLKRIGGRDIMGTLKQLPDALAHTIRDPQKAFQNYLYPIEEWNLPKPVELSLMFGEELQKNITSTVVGVGRELSKIPFKVFKTYKHFGESEQPKWENRWLGEIESYPEIALRKTQEYLDMGIDDTTATIAGIVGVGSEAILDVAIMGMWIKKGATAVQKGHTLELQEKIGAWKLLGEPKDASGVTKNMRQLSHQFHPDLMGGSKTAQTQINNAYSILKKVGVPTTKELVQAQSGIIAGKALSPISRIMEMPRPMSTLPFPQLTERAGYIPIEQYQTIKTPAMGLSLRITPMKPVTTSQIKTAHTVAKNKLLVKPDGTMAPQYRELAKGLTGKSSMKEMTEDEAQLFVDSIKNIKTKFIGGKETPPTVSKTTSVIPQDFFTKQYKEPTLAKLITPGDTYLRTIGTYDLVEDLITAKTKLEIERTELFTWLDKMEKSILKFEKTPEIKKIIAGITNTPTDTHKKWFDLLNTHPTAKDAALTGPEANFFTELRGLTDGLLARTNEVRELVNLEPINKMSAYITHIRDVFGRAEIREKYPFPEEIKYWLEYINPKHIYNPTAMKRIIQEPDKLAQDPFRALKAMVGMDLKQIYLESPHKLFSEKIKALESTIPSETRKWTEAYVREVILGQPTGIDRVTNETMSRMGITKLVDTVLKPFGRKLDVNPVKQITGTLSRLIHDATIWGKAKLPLRNLTQRMLTLGLYDTKAFVKGMLPTNKKLEQMIKESDFFKISNKQFMEALPKGAFGKLERIGFIPYGKTHTINVKGAMRTSYHASMELVNNPKYAKLGWTMDDVMKEMEYGANTTQYWYNLMGMPEIYRSGGTRILGVLQSWWQNYTMKYWREMIVRGVTGKTGWGKEIPTKWRIGSLRHITSSLMFTEGTRRAFGLNYGQVALLGALPSYLSPPGQIAVGLFNYIFGKTEYQREKAKRQIKWSISAFIPGSGAWRDYNRAWESGNLKELFFYIDNQPDKGGDLDIDWEKELDNKIQHIDWKKELL